MMIENIVRPEPRGDTTKLAQACQRKGCPRRSNAWGERCSADRRIDANRAIAARIGLLELGRAAAAATALHLARDEAQELPGDRDDLLLGQPALTQLPVDRLREDDGGAGIAGE